MRSASNARSGFISVNVNGEPLGRLLYSPILWLILFALVVFYVVYRDHLPVTSGPPPAPPLSASRNQQPPLSQSIYARKGSSAGVEFTIPASGNYSVTIRESTGNNVVINKLFTQPAQYSFKESNFEGERYFEPGRYVVSLNAKKESPAKAFVEIRSLDSRNDTQP